MRLRTLIADDEPLARERLTSLLSADADLEIVAECRNGTEVIAALRSQPIDVLFLDIQMPGNGGFEVIEQIGAAHMPVTVFVTAHNEYALKAFEVQALDYLTKPIEWERLQATLVRVKDKVASSAALLSRNKWESLLESLETKIGARKEYPKRLLVPDGPRNSFINVNDIDWIEAADYYCCLHVGTRNLMLRETIKQIAETLDPKNFVRVHRSSIVNVDRIREIFREGRSEGSVVLLSGQKLRMSKAGWQSLLALGRI